MKVAKKIREALGLNPWNMARKLKKPIQSYQALERTTANPRLEDLLKLHDVATADLGWTSEQYLLELRAEFTSRNTKGKKKK
jgi:transcriptional regulator with XRE-family HTH domain